MIQENYYELLYMSRQGCEDALMALFNQCMETVRMIARMQVSHEEMYQPYCDDIIQEVSGSIFTAAETYREDQNTRFETYLSVIIRKRTWRVMARMRKYLCRYGYMSSLDAPTPEGDSYYEIIEQRNPMYDPVYAMEYHDASDHLYDCLRSMKPMELDAVASWMMNETYREAAERNGIPIKTWDGRRSRATKKIRQAIRGK
ncbi:MAG: sigma-70 family RNA polymerase sigma factor [Solobacterium sp.]|nr:sigma-70 family RNA polymerase sigma factor [Solobacterium sp.]MBQ9822949.1 sigma-70 family RNA polymerase sigma factor [Solobacterium sp.]